MRATIALALTLAASVPPAAAFAADAPRSESLLAIAPAAIVDERPVAATIEGTKTVPARVRSGGTVVNVLVREGDAVTAGQVMAVLKDAKLLAQKSGADARVDEAKARLAQARQDVVRNRPLVPQGVTSQAQLEAMETAATAAAEALRAAEAERGVLAQRVAETQVLAPAAGRVVRIAMSLGTELMPGEALGLVATGPTLVRLRLPQGGAIALKAGDTVRVDDITPAGAVKATVSLVYPRVEDGAVVADATAPDLAGAFIGQRVRAWVPEGRRQAILVPADYLINRFGLDYARLRGADGHVSDVPVQRGTTHTPGAAGQPALVEVLSGLRAGDVVVKP
ncbi:efflux RND transporter periplasmic adaptor subunit [Nitrospirillum viridazoti]|uniref:Efflux transporter periplasmic adaptor subunit n=1 Tax=Nitrospirillum viridazoti CBAmc TaxID=1441467 RepID=A0A248JZR4_9PROT|nr:efflux RND transporter periplasmic adaptor subunit [Nitrospirillum amazonense]ASG24049.1 efflux transporter periplasmic adaptor subunit [Nitrospirillum amazonense CBAmc]TWB40969.1 RND family efflux transporter MFP subunit [Nitrospirillum amazonense]